MSLLGREPRQRFVRSALAVLAGLAVALLSLSWTHPFAFIGFGTVGVVLLIGGGLLYLSTAFSFGLRAPD